MPEALPQGFNPNWKETAGFQSLVGLHDVTVFTAEKDTSGQAPFWKLTLRIDGGPFDGEDVKENYVGLTEKTIFRLYSILKAAGVSETYYRHNADGTPGGQWIAFPTKDELEGLKLRALVRNEPWQGNDQETKQPAWNADGTPKMLDSNRVDRYYAVGENVDLSSLTGTDGELKPLKPRYAKGVDPNNPTLAGSGGGGFGGAAGGFGAPAGGVQQPIPGGPWNNPGQPGQPGAQQAGPGTSGW